MKILHIHAKSKIEVKLSPAQIKSLPSKIGIITTIQYLDQLDRIVKELKGVKGGQILGCSIGRAERIKNKVNTFLYIGSGTFHPLKIYEKTKKTVYCFNPKTKQLTKLSKELYERFENKKRTALIKFYSAEKIGILVSIKPGQNNLKKALEIKKKLKNKEGHIFIFDTLDINELDNFPFIECWINTACPRIADEKSNILNAEDLRC